jgi:trk system potassium uptake protein TrkH
VLGVIAPLIVIGGIGFPVLQECARGIRAATARILHAFRGSPAASSAPAGLSLHSKVALLATVVLIVAGAEGLLLVEPPTGGQRDRIGRTPIYGPGEKSVGDWQDMDADGRAREAVFQSISARTGGLSTFDLKELSNAGKLWLCGLMVVGAGPAGAGGGMRTVTVALLLAATVAALRRRRSAEAFRRAAGEEVMNRFLAAAVLYASLIGATTLLLAIAMRPGFELVDLLFEACSACGNVGLSTGVTHSLNLFGQGVVVAAMFLGRVGLLSLLAAASGRMWAAESQRTPLA